MLEVRFPGALPADQAEQRAAVIATRMSQSAALREVFDGVLAVTHRPVTGDRSAADGRPGSDDRAGQLLARPLPGRVGELRGLPERELEGLQGVAQRAGVEGPEVRR